MKKIQFAAIGISSKTNKGGLSILFTSMENLPAGSFVSLSFNGKSYHFQVEEVKTQFLKREELLIKAQECGYWAEKLGRKDTDPRDLLNLEVIPVTDPEMIKKIREWSSFC